MLIGIPVSSLIEPVGSLGEAIEARRQVRDETPVPKRHALGDRHVGDIDAETGRDGHRQQGALRRHCRRIRPVQATLCSRLVA